MKLGSDELTQVVRKMAAHRGGREFQAAIDLAESTLPQCEDDEGRVAVLLEAQRAAVEAGIADEAKGFAAQVLALDSGVPSSKKLLGGP